MCLFLVTCPVDFTWYLSMCFKEYTTPMTWTQAMTSCQQEGGFLFHVSTTDRQTFVQGAFGKLYIMEESIFKVLQKVRSIYRYFKVL